MSTPKFTLKTVVFTTESVSNNSLPALRKATDILTELMLQVENLEPLPANIIYLNEDERLTVNDTYFDLSGKKRVKHSSFFRDYTQKIIDTFDPVSPEKTQYLIIYHFTEEEKRKLGLQESINGSYYVDQNKYMEAWVAADIDEEAPANRTRYYVNREGDKVKLTNLERLILHEGGHALVHFSGRKAELVAKYGEDPVHYLDYQKHDVALIFHEVSFKPWSMMAYIIALATQLLGLLKLEAKEPIIPTPESKINAWAMGIQLFEDYVPPGGKYRGGQYAEKGSLSWRNNNPGNLRWSPYEKDNVNNFSVFDTYETGWKALIHQLRIAADGRSSVYRPTMTLLEFFQVYAPSGDNNHPETYAKFVADYMKVPVTTIIKDLI